MFGALLCKATLMTVVCVGFFFFSFSLYVAGVNFFLFFYFLVHFHKIMVWSVIHENK